ncbi:ribosome maturation factor RimM [Tabrizicola fusiformis]|uniref:ribosome maturation factor RimM n=1 Tax=Tabrizicola sp. SY72 TaxID=2741673 RepID=UPI0015734D33|nr:ribosome maturation factor RimM [Tabrizicola sp. SY72]NTT87181.1 16S rRNA processing protein RimM [Tabrizicola sp. SY72]
MAADSDRICIGSIAGAFGVGGEVRLKSFCAEPTAIADYGPVFTEDGSRSFKITLSRPVAGGLGARLSGVKTKEEADALRGAGLYVDRTRLPKLPADEFYHADLIGLEVRDTGGALLGLLHAIHNHGAGDILEVTGNGRKVALMIPFTRAAVPTVDLAARRIIADLPEGLD